MTNLVKKLAQKIKQPGLEYKFLFLGKANNLEATPSRDTLDQHIGSINETISLLETRNRSGLIWKAKYYENEHHGSVSVNAIYDGLKFIFEGYDMSNSFSKTITDRKNEFEQFSKKVGVAFMPEESLLNYFGWDALDNKNYEKAYEYFLYNVNNFPNSPSAMESLANYYKERGDKKNGIKYYEKCSKLVPDNQGIKDKIELMKK